jgi:hypothetical protein
MCSDDAETKCPRKDGLGNHLSRVLQKNRTHGDASFPRIVSSHPYRDTTILVIESQPGQFIASVQKADGSVEMLLNPIRGDHFKHAQAAHKYAKRVVRGKPLQPRKRSEPRA